MGNAICCKHIRKIGVIKSMNIKLPNNSVKLFYIEGILIAFLSYFTRIIRSSYIFFILLILILLLFFFYSIVRYKHYKSFFKLKASRKYLVLENGIFLTGIIYSLFMEHYIFRGSGEVNFLYILSLIIFIFPSIIGNIRLSQQKK